MKRIELYRQRLSELEAKRGQLLRAGRYAEMMNLDSKISNAKVLVAEAEKYEARPLRELLDAQQVEKSGIIPLIMECHLAADFLADCAFTLKETIHKLGFEPVTLFPDIQEIIRRSELFASLPCNKGEDLMNAITDNETLIAALHKKTLSYIRQRLSKKLTRKRKEI